MTDLRQVVRQQLETVWAHHTKLVVGVSGGADSLALLHVLAHLWPADRLIVAHLDHGWRPDAGLDAAFVRETAVSLNLPCFIKQIDLPALAQQEKQSLEAAGRTARYSFFRELVQQTEATAVVVAHHADDQAETVLMHLIRGSGTAGLQGMRAENEIAGVTVLRPFLSVSRRQIEAYCTTHGLTPRHDSTNEDLTQLRNQIRHQIMPQLSELNPQFVRHLGQLAAVVQADTALLNTLTEEALKRLVVERGDGWYRLDMTSWATLPLSLKRSVLKTAVSELTTTPDHEVGFATIQQAIVRLDKNQVGTEATLPEGITLTVGYQTAVLAHPTAPLPSLPLPQLTTASLSLPVPGTVSLANGWKVTGELIPANWERVKQNQDPWQAFLLPPHEPLFVRTRQPGERFPPLGMGGKTTPLKKMMIDRKIPARYREQWPLVSTANQILWVVGHHISELGQVTPQTAVYLHLRCHPPAS